jgi:hypothetical protein
LSLKRKKKKKNSFQGQRNVDSHLSIGGNPHSQQKINGKFTFSWVSKFPLLSEVIF